MFPNHIKEAIRTLKASWWELLLAKWFGEKSYGYDSGVRVTVHRYKGKSYLTDVKTVEGD